MKAARAFRLGRAAAARRFTGAVVRLDGRRRRAIARRMAAAGWPAWRIALALRLPRSSLERMLAAAPAEMVWGRRAAALIAAAFGEAA